MYAVHGIDSLGDAWYGSAIGAVPRRVQCAAHMHMSGAIHAAHGNKVCLNNVWHGSPFGPVNVANFARAQMHRSNSSRYAVHATDMYLGDIRLAQWHHKLCSAYAHERWHANTKCASMLCSMAVYLAL